MVKKAEIRSSFNTTTVTGTTFREPHPRSHHKGSTDRVQTGDRLYPVHLIANSLYNSTYNIWVHSPPPLQADKLNDLSFFKHRKEGWLISGTAVPSWRGEPAGAPVGSRSFAVQCWLCGSHYDNVAVLQLRAIRAWYSWGWLAPCAICQTTPTSCMSAN